MAVVLRQFSLLSKSQAASFSAVARVFAFGTGDDGQLGIPDGEKTGLTNTYVELQPKPVEALDGLDVIQIDASTNHSAAVTSDGRVLTWGKGDYGKLGLGDTDSVGIPQFVDYFDGEKIVQVSCGDSHTAALSESGSVFTWGWGGSFLMGAGALGHGDGDESRPRRISTFQDYEHEFKVVQIASGAAHMMALTDDGEIWAWGKGEYGRLGSGGSSDQPTPEPIEYFEGTPVTRIACGSAFSLAVTEDGELYTWGRNDQGQLGLGGGLSMDVYSLESYPVANEELEHKTVTSIGGGDGGAAAVTDEGALYSWGNRGWMEPRLLTAVSDIPMMQADAGTNFAAAVSRDGRLFTWSKGRHSALGVGDKSGRKQPTEVEGLEGVVQVACGAKHTLALVR